MGACDHPYAIRMLANRFSVVPAQTANGKPFFLMNLPYYLGTRIPEYAGYLVSSHSLPG